MSSMSCGVPIIRSEGFNLIIWNTGDASGSYTIKPAGRDHKIADWLKKQDVTPSPYGSSPSDKHLAIELSFERSSRSLSST
jgi:hypothetical protein